MVFSKQRFESEVCREVVILNKEQTKEIATIYVDLYRKYNEAMHAAIMVQHQSRWNNK